MAEPQNFHFFYFIGWVYLKFLYHNKQSWDYFLLSTDDFTSIQVLIDDGHSPYTLESRQFNLKSPTLSNLVFVSVLHTYGDNILATTIDIFISSPKTSSLAIANAVLQ